MAHSSNPENVQAALDRVAAGHERVSNAQKEELLRLRRETVIGAGLKMFSRVLEENLSAMQKNGSRTANLEHHFEIALANSHRADVYTNAMGAALEKRLSEYIATIERQLHFAVLRPVNGSLVEHLSRKHYIAARAQFLEDMRGDSAEAMTSLESR